jgi:hypothetical protein
MSSRSGHGEVFPDSQKQTPSFAHLARRTWTSVKPVVSNQARRTELLCASVKPNCIFRPGPKPELPREPGFKASFEKASHVPFALLINEEFAQSGEGVDLSSEDFIDKLWLLAVTLVLIMVSEENLLEPGKMLKTVKAKTGEGPAISYWSPNFLGRVYRASGISAREFRSGTSQRAHWKRGHIKSQPHGPKRALRKIIWIQPYRAGSG